MPTTIKVITADWLRTLRPRPCWPYLDLADQLCPVKAVDLTDLRRWRRVPSLDAVRRKMDVGVPAISIPVRDRLWMLLRREILGTPGLLCLARSFAARVFRRCAGREPDEELRGAVQSAIAGLTLVRLGERWDGL